MRQIFKSSSRKYSKIIFRQLFEKESSTYTYILGCSATRQAILIDSVDTQVSRDLLLLKELNLNLLYTVETHVHADHITGAFSIKKQLPSVQSILSANSGASFQGLKQVKEGDHIEFGNEKVQVLEVNGHTHGCVAYFYESKETNLIFTGDALLIRTCGRTDFQQGNPAKLFQNVKNKIYTLPDNTIIYPGHDYRGFTQSTVEEEKKFNSRIPQTQTEQGFIEIMNNLKLPNPKLIDVAVPANMNGGKTQ